MKKQKRPSPSPQAFTEENAPEGYGGRDEKPPDTLNVSGGQTF
jgi:hypothetical protein